MSGISPLRFQPIYQTRVWGGRRLESLLGRKLPNSQPYGESWELCDRPEAQSIVARGLSPEKHCTNCGRGIARRCLARAIAIIPPNAFRSS